jgi:hypothetical protein
MSLLFHIGPLPTIANVKLLINAAVSMGRRNTRTKS